VAIFLANASKTCEVAHMAQKNWDIEEQEREKRIENILLMTDREAVIVSVALLEAAISTIISKRRADDDEQTSFIPLDRQVTTAAMLGILDSNDTTFLRAALRVRNAFAHHVEMDLTNSEVEKRFNEMVECASRFKNNLKGVTTGKSRLTRNRLNARSSKQFVLLVIQFESRLIRISKQMAKIEPIHLSAVEYFHGKIKLKK
jgi:hypothetical protein